jgi:uncharacterized protein YdeI (YjbR/CyaY-like superfamily)
MLAATTARSRPPLSELAIPGELKKALAARPAAQAAFDTLPPAQKSQIVAWVSEAKGEARVRRAGQAAARLTGGR